jgi:hypothetical protein
VSDVAASLLIVWSYAASPGSRERKGRMPPQKAENQHNVPTIFLLHACASHSKFQLITKDLGKWR